MLFNFLIYTNAYKNMKSPDGIKLGNRQVSGIIGFPNDLTACSTEAVWHSKQYATAGVH